MNKSRKKYDFTLYAYCLMGNHVHLLLMENETKLATIFKSIGSAFVFWYNKKYDRVGHLFQDRFKSEPVESDRYFITLMRYILRNPVVAGLCTLAEEYKYSSGREFLMGKEGIIDRDLMFTIMSREEWREFVHKEMNDKGSEIDEDKKSRCSNARAKKLIFEAFGTFTPTVGNDMDRVFFDHTVRRLHEQGISIRQMSRLTGVSRRVIERAVRKRSLDI